MSDLSGCSSAWKGRGAARNGLFDDLSADPILTLCLGKQEKRPETAELDPRHHCNLHHIEWGSPRTIALIFSGSAKS